MPVAYRTEGNQRRYGQYHLKRLTFILHARELGFSLDDIRELINLSEEDDVKDHAADAIAEKHLKEIEFKIRRLQSLQSELKGMLNTCMNHHSERCGVIDVLSDHSLCGHSHRIGE